MKTCKLCGNTKPLSEFHKHNGFRDGLYLYCKVCTNEKNRESWHRHAEVRKAESRKWQHEHKEWRRENVNKKYRELRDAVLDNYGGKCSVCGFDDRRALCLDHVNGNGLKERKLTSAASIMRRIIREGYPDDYQILCANCNLIKAIEKREIPVSDVGRRC